MKKGFLYFCREGNIAEAIKMVQHNSDVLTLRDGDGVSGLLWACDRGHTELVIELMNAGADVEGSDNAGSTPLHYACLSNREELVRLLLSRGMKQFAKKKICVFFFFHKQNNNKGADPFAKDNDGTTPKELADIPSVVSMLEEAVK
jgi:ankyrin repeat protein